MNADHADERSWDGRGETAAKRRSDVADLGSGTGKRTDVWRGSVLECAKRQPPLSPAPTRRGSATFPGLRDAPRGLDRRRDMNVLLDTCALLTFWQPA